MPTTPQVSMTHADQKGFAYGLAALVPSSAVILAAMRRPGFVKATNPAVRLVMVVAPAMYIGHIANSLEEQDQMAQRIAHLKRHETNPSPVPNPVVHDHILSLHLQDQQNEHVNVVPKLGLRHRMTNATSRKPQYISKDDWTQQENEMEKVRATMIGKLRDYQRSMETIGGKPLTKN